MTKKKRIELTRLQGAMAIASFSAGTVICMACLFFVPPYGEISSTAMMAVSEFLVLCGGLLGAKASFDMRMQRFEARVLNEIHEGEMPGRQMPDRVGHDGNGYAHNEDLRLNDNDQTYE